MAGTAVALGPLPFLSALWDHYHLTELLDAQLAWDPRQCRVSPGVRLKALVVNILAGRVPLSRLDEWFQTTDVELALASGVAAADLSDDSLARALDKLAAAGPRRVFSSVALTLAHPPVGPWWCHWDSTSQSVAGLYAGDVAADDLHSTLG